MVGIQASTARPPVADNLVTGVVTPTSGKPVGTIPPGQPDRVEISIEARAAAARQRPRLPGSDSFESELDKTRTPTVKLPGPTKPAQELVARIVPKPAAAEVKAGELVTARTGHGQNGAKGTGIPVTAVFTPLGSQGALEPSNNWATLTGEASATRAQQYSGLETPLVKLDLGVSADLEGKLTIGLSTGEHVRSQGSLSGLKAAEIYRKVSAHASGESANPTTSFRKVDIFA